MTPSLLRPFCHTWLSASETRGRTYIPRSLYRRCLFAGRPEAPAGTMREMFGHQNECVKSWNRRDGRRTCCVTLAQEPLQCQRKAVFASPPVTPMPENTTTSMRGSTAPQFHSAAWKQGVAGAQETFRCWVPTAVELQAQMNNPFTGTYQKKVQALEEHEEREKDLRQKLDSAKMLFGMLTSVLSTCASRGDSAAQALEHFTKAMPDATDIFRAIAEPTCTSSCGAPECSPGDGLQPCDTLASVCGDGARDIDLFSDDGASEVSDSANNDEDFGDTACGWTGDRDDLESTRCSTGSCSAPSDSTLFSAAEKQSSDSAPSTDAAEHETADIVSTAHAQLSSNAPLPGTEGAPGETALPSLRPEPPQMPAAKKLRRR